MLRSLAMRTFIIALIACLRGALKSRATLALENAALCQQLAVYLRTNQRARLRTEDRLFWIALRRLWPNWGTHDCLQRHTPTPPCTAALVEIPEGGSRSGRSTGSGRKSANTAAARKRKEGRSADRLRPSPMATAIATPHCEQART